MFAKMKNSKGFTLVELMIVVAIIGILAAVAVPYYQKYIQKSRLTSKVFPGLHSIETNLTTYYSMQGAFPSSSGATWSQIIGDADTTCFSVAMSTTKLEITNIANKSASCQMASLPGSTLDISAVSTNGAINWVIQSTTLSSNLGLTR